MLSVRVQTVDTPYTPSRTHLNMPSHTRSPLIKETTSLQGHKLSGLKLSTATSSSPAGRPLRQLRADSPERGGLTIKTLGTAYHMINLYIFFYVYYIESSFCGLCVASSLLLSLLILLAEASCRVWKAVYSRVNQLLIPPVFGPLRAINSGRGFLHPTTIGSSKSARHTCGEQLAVGNSSLGAQGRESVDQRFPCGTGLCLAIDRTTTTRALQAICRRCCQTPAFN